MLLGLAGAEVEGAGGAPVVVGRAGSSVLGLVVNLNGKAEVSTLPDNGHIEGANVLHDGVVGRVEEQPHHAIVLLLLLGGLLLLLGILGLLGSPGLSLELLLEGLVKVALASQLPGRLDPVVGPGLGSLAHDLLPGAELQLDRGDVGVLQADPLHGVDVLAPVLLELGQGGVQVLVLVEVLELLLGPGLDVTLLGLDDHAAMSHAVGLAHVLVAEEPEKPRI